MDPAQLLDTDPTLMFFLISLKSQLYNPCKCLSKMSLYSKISSAVRKHGYTSIIIGETFFNAMLSTMVE